MKLIDIPGLNYRRIRPANWREALQASDLLAKANFFPFLLLMAVAFTVFQFETLRALVASAFMIRSARA